MPTAARRDCRRRGRRHCGGHTYNDPLNKTDPLGLRPGEPEFTYEDPCAHLARDAGAGRYDQTGLMVRDGQCGYVTVGSENIACALRFSVRICLHAAKMAEIAKRTAADDYGQLTDWSDGPTYGRYAGEPPDGSRGNAYQHVIWSALLAVDFGEQTAKELGELHESTDPGGPNTQMHRQMDLANNYYGRQFGLRYGASAGGSYTRALPLVRQPAKAFVDAGHACERVDSDPSFIGHEGRFVDPTRCGIR